MHFDLCCVDLSRYCLSELSPVCAIVGGVLGQEVIKVSSVRPAPHLLGHICP